MILPNLYKPTGNYTPNDHLIMVDALNSTIPCPHEKPLAETYLAEYDINTGELIKAHYKSVKFGSLSHETSFWIRSTPDLSGFQVITSPNKFLQGHNVYGYSDISGLLFQSLEEGLKRLPDGYFLETYLAYKSSIAYEDVKIAGLDLNAMFNLGSPEKVSQLQRFADEFIRMGRLKPHRNKNTHYWGSKGHSDYFWRMYDKWSEREDKKKLGYLTIDQKNYCYSAIRMELSFDERELQNRGLDNLYALSLQPLYDLYKSYLDKMTISTSLDVDDLTNLEPSLHQTYIAWRYSPFPIETIVPIKATRYRYIKDIKEQIGVDVSVPFNPEANAMRLVLPNLKDLTPMGLPSWETTQQEGLFCRTLEGLGTLVPDSSTASSEEGQNEEEDSQESETCSIEAENTTTTTKNRPVPPENELVIRFHRGDLEHERSKPNLRLQAITASTDGKHLSSSGDRQHNQRAFNSYG